MQDEVLCEHFVFNPHDKNYATEVLGPWLHKIAAIEPRVVLFQEAYFAQCELGLWKVTTGQRATPLRAMIALEREAAQTLLFDNMKIRRFPFTSISFVHNLSKYDGSFPTPEKCAVVYDFPLNTTAIEHINTFTIPVLEKIGCGLVQLKLCKKFGWCAKTILGTLVIETILRFSDPVGACNNLVGEVVHTICTLNRDDWQHFQIPQTTSRFLFQRAAEMFKVTDELTGGK